MTLLDWLIVLGAVAMGLRGYRQGLVVGALALAGFAAGALVGARLGPELLEGGSSSPYAPLTALMGGVLLGSLFAGVTEWVGHALRMRLIRGSALTGLDGAGGVALMVALALAIAWVLGAVALNTPGLGDLRDSVQRSRILAAMYEAVPPTGPVLNVLNRVGRTPSIQGPQAEVRPPDKGIARDPDVDAAGPSVVRVLGTACGLGVAGSGWVAGPGVVVTNAHVVAGQDDTTVQIRDGTQLGASAIHYEPRNDLAVLRVDGLGAPALELVSDPAAGTAAAVLGYPENGPYKVAPARLGETSEALSQSSYGRGPIRREMTPFRGRVVSGNSGGPVVDEAGRVLATVFASTVGGGEASGLGVPNAIVSRALGRAGESVSTGACAA